MLFTLVSKLLLFRFLWPVTKIKIWTYFQLSLHYTLFQKIVLQVLLTNKAINRIKFSRQKLWKFSRQNEGHPGFVPEMRHEIDGVRVRDVGNEKLRLSRSVHGAARWLDENVWLWRVRLQADVWKLRFRHRRSRLLLLEAIKRGFSRCQGFLFLVYLKVFK